MGAMHGQLTASEYDAFRELIQRQTGIHLGDRKQQLLRARLRRRMRAAGFRHFGDYYEHVRADETGVELTELIDAITTNTTQLFREQPHFDFLARTLREWSAPGACPRRPIIRIWSAACSSGEEPYSIAMTADDALAGRPTQVKVLATDISARMLRRARLGLFEKDRLRDVPAEFQRRYFEWDCDDDRVRVSEKISGLITFARANLLDDALPLRNPIDLIFCRNVMIYFDRATQERLVQRLAERLSPGGYLLIGHSESLSAIRHPLRYVGPTTYQKPATGRA